MSRKTKEKLDVEVKLTNDELINRGKMLAEALRQVEREKSRLKFIQAEHTARIKEGESSSFELLRSIEKQSELRPVECEILYNWEKKIKTWVRTDTGEEAKVDIISEYDCQEEAKLRSEDPVEPTDEVAAQLVLEPQTVPEPVAEDVK